jgi:hypothetical protein
MENRITAAEARQIVEEEINKSLDSIFSDIKELALQGQSQLLVEKELTSSQHNYLKKLGYVIWKSPTLEGHVISWGI